MPFRYPSHRLPEIVRARKVVREGQALEFRPYKEHSLTLSVDLDLADGPLINLRLEVNAPRPDETETYRAAMILDGTRIRGVDFRELPQKRFYRVRIPAGWHQNILDPNLASDDANRHEGLPDFKVADLADYLKKIAELWHIQLPSEPTLL